MDRYNKYQTKQLHAHTYPCTRKSWRLVLGWVTTKEYHPLPRLDRQMSTYGVLTKTFNSNNNNSLDKWSLGVWGWVHWIITTFVIPCVHAQHGRLAFSVVALAVWNSLPSYIKAIPLFKTFHPNTRDSLNNTRNKLQKYAFRRVWPATKSGWSWAIDSYIKR